MVTQAVDGPETKPVNASGPPAATDLRSDLAYQTASLQHVSRTFALTIPQLPPALGAVVGNAYLLCRIADTIEDSETLNLAQKHEYYARFLAVVAGSEAPEVIAAELPPLLGGQVLEAERDLIANLPRVVRILRSFSEREQAALLRCVRIMAEGMEEFQRTSCAKGLRDQAHLDAYCYHVAGVVGEMLTELFCVHSEAIAAREAELNRLAISFGQGLQMTNILKDIWDDHAREMCWLPQTLFKRFGVDLGRLDGASRDSGFHMALGNLIGVARGHLHNALRYTLLIPKSEPGVRKFCLWAIGMAVLTLRKVNRRRGFTSGAEVKISRRSVRATILLTSALGWSDTLLRAAFWLLTLGLPRLKPKNERC